MTEQPAIQIDSDISRAWSIPAPFYTDPGVLAQEKERVFARTWQVAGHCRQLAKPGDFFTMELFGEPLLLLRGAQGEFRGFFNVCRHRTGPPAEGCCPRKRFAWRYDCLVYVPDASVVRRS